MKFNKFKDCQSIFQKAREVLGRDSRFSVQQDFTERVKLHRRELGKEMVKARNDGHYAVIRYDKLIINNDIFKYDDSKGSIVCIGQRTRRGRYRGARGLMDQADDRFTVLTPTEGGNRNSVVATPLVTDERRNNDSVA